MNVYLIEIRIWDAPCYEFAHFTNEELADGIIEVHQTIDGWRQDQLVEALGYWRGKKQDIKRVWTSGRWDEQSSKAIGKWDYEVSKVQLAQALWPTPASEDPIAQGDGRRSYPTDRPNHYRRLPVGTTTAVSLIHPHTGTGMPPPDNTMTRRTREVCLPASGQYSGDATSGLQSATRSYAAVGALFWVLVGLVLQSQRIC